MILYRIRNLAIGALMLFLLYIPCHGQGIRKEWHEMTPKEKLSLMEAIHYAQSEHDIYFKMGNLHGQKFGEIHFNTRTDFLDGDNGSGEFQNDEFAAWHRWAILTIEKYLQEFQPELCMPFWDWRTYQSKSDEMWNNTHLGQFNSTSNWFVSLGRRTSASSNELGSTSEVDFVKSQSSWYNFTLQLEGGFSGGTDVHPGGHVWTGGVMAGGNSPWDPVFFFHHGMVDKIWQEWEEANGKTSYNVTLLTNDLGGNSHYLWPEDVDPDNIKDSKKLGVFFAENGHVTLHDYTVSNARRSNEVFFYQHDINVGSNFTVPNGRNAEIKSYSKIKFSNGFKAKSGSHFKASIGSEAMFKTDCNCSGSNSSGRSSGILAQTQNRENLYLEPEKVTLEWSVHPNPATHYLTITSSAEAQIKIFSLDGSLLVDLGRVENHRTIDVSNLDPGLYFLKLTSNGSEKTKKIVVK